MDIRRRLIKQIADRGFARRNVSLGATPDIRARKTPEIYWQAMWRGKAGQLPGRFAAFGLIIATALYGLNVGGHYGTSQATQPSLADKLGRAIGLKVRQINVKGSRHLDVNTLLKAVGVRKNSSMLGFDVLAARRRLERIDWVASAEVMKLFPGRVLVNIVEREPYALWQLDGVHRVIDREGIVLGGINVSTYTYLPLVVGEGAAKKADKILKIMSLMPALKTRVRALVRVADRRWNLNLFNGMTIMLPEYDVQKAVVELSRLEKKYALLSRNLSLVDFRLPDRITLRPIVKSATKNTPVNVPVL